MRTQIVEYLSPYLYLKIRVFVGVRVAFRMEVNMKLLAIVAVLSLETCTALYFHMGETEKKCFLEEIPDETMVTGKNIFVA